MHLPLHLLRGGRLANYDTALSIQGPDCCGSYLACNDDFCAAALSVQGPGGCGRPLVCDSDYCGSQAQIDFQPRTGGDYVCVVNGICESGAYTLAYRGTPCEPTATEPATWGHVKSLYR